MKSMVPYTIEQIEAAYDKGFKDGKAKAETERHEPHIYVENNGFPYCPTCGREVD